MEALANYSALMLLETRNPAAFRELLQKFRDDLLAKSSKGQQLTVAGPVTLGLRLSSSQFPNGYEAISYGRGTWLIHMLRCMLVMPSVAGLRGRRAAGTRLSFALLESCERNTKENQ